MRRLLILSLTLCPAVSAWADDTPAKPNTLSPAEVDHGWILLFDGESTFGWRSPNDSKWTVLDGMLAPQAGKPGLLVTTSPFRDYRLEFDFRRTADSDAVVLVGSDADGRVDVDLRKPEGYARKVELVNYFGSAWVHAEVNVKGGFAASKVYRTTGVLGGGQAARPPVPAGDLPKKSGHIALSGNGVIFRSIKVRPTGTDALFNGTDLTGWKEFPGKKSKFSVTPDHAIHLEGGPGDLQSDGQWADFVLQLQCKSNGDHCNSGVFFRCRPGEFEQGYEAQIRNEFTGEPKQEYTIEEYDPQTHELAGTKKEKFTAVDYGTGGVYRRMPARKELSKDREWFGMTIVASGRHIAVWVNGVQATDWTDNRPPADNARKGCYLEKGPVSLQGHEAAVEDLEFRDIQVQDLAPPAEEKKP